ncbi:MAG: hypothetical protein Q8M96_01940 [Rubrivivax sp.]|nr:hypothetical protein [Rubrivivax sp.]
MFRMLCGWMLVTLLAAPTAQAVELTATERTWLHAAVPVLQFAREQRLPLDVIVQPQDTPGHTPMGMAFVDGRCKLVLSMRGNPEAQATLDRMPSGLQGLLVEAIAAHELGHCWRHVSRQWGTLPDSLQDISAYDRVSSENAQLLREMWRTRREEGFADLVGLAWILKHHPQRYDEVHAWHVKLRGQPVVDTGPHDTRVWVQLAADKHRFTAGSSIFEQVQALWLAGLTGGTVDRRARAQTAVPTPTPSGAVADSTGRAGFVPQVQSRQDQARGR